MKTVTKTIPAGVFGLALTVMLSSAQTQVDLSSQVRNIDFTSATSTKPIRTGAILPGTCSSGEAFFLTSGAVGSNLQFCMPGNVWVAQGGLGAQIVQVGAGPLVAKTSGVTLGVGTNCSVATVCNTRVGGVSYAYVGTSIISLSGGTPTVRIYISDGSDGAPAGTIKVRNSLAAGVSCSGGCTVENSQSSFPGMSIPLALWAASSPGLWDVSGQDLRAALSTGESPFAGAGISIAQGSSSSIAVDTTAIPQKFSGSGPPALIALSSLGDFYSDVANNDTYQCFSPGPCTAAAPGNWVKIDPGAGGAAQTAITGLYATYNSLNYYPLYSSNGLPDASAFNWMNQPAGTTRAAVGSHAVHLTMPPPAINGNNLAMLQDGTVLSPVAFTLRGTFSGCVIPSTVDGALCAIGLTDGTRVVSFGLTALSGSYAIGVVNWSNKTTLNSVAAQVRLPELPMLALKLALAGGNLLFYISVDGGASYDLMSSLPVTTFFASATGLSGVWMVNNNSTNGLSAATLVDWRIN